MTLDRALQRAGSVDRVEPGLAEQVARRIVDDLGGPGQVYPVIQELRAFGCKTLAKIAQGLSARGVLTARGNRSWSLSAVRNVLVTCEGAAA